MRNTAFALKIVGFVVAAGAAVAGVYEVARISSVRSLKESIGTTLQAGDYVAAIAAFDALQKAAPEEAVGEQAKVATAKRLLAADEDLNRAKRAAEQHAWSDVQALLRDSEAIANATFTRHQEAVDLYHLAEAYAAGERHEATITLEGLKGDAANEKTKRTDAEKRAAELSGTLKARESALSDAARALQDSKKETEAKQAALAAEQARAASLAAQVEKEMKQKFFNEFTTYRDLAQKGREQLDSATAEIQAKRDVTALVYLSQGKVLFEEAKNKTNDLRNSRTPSAYQPHVNDLLSAFGAFLEASKQLRNAVVYIEDQGSAEFTAAFGAGKTALGNGVSYLTSVSEFIAGNQ